MPPYPTRPLLALTALVFVGTLYSTYASTYLDTSNPLLTHLPHPLHTTHYFASKSNILNLLFTKKLWGWSTLTFFLLYFTSPPLIRHRERLIKWAVETAVWVAFTGWFLGPSLFDRLTVSLGGECILHLPSGALVSVPEQLCYKRAMVNPQTHPHLFAASLVLPADTWSQVPRIRRGHDISGHLFLLTMSILFLSEQTQVTFEHAERMRTRSVPWYHWMAMTGAVCVLALAYFAAWTTSVYFHTPAEKLSGFLLGVAGYSLTRVPFLNRRM